MGRPYGSRLLLVVCGALAVLLAAFAVLQYRWSARVAAADVQREKEHLNTAASLFAAEFNRLAGEAASYLQNDAAAALESHERTPVAPKLLTEIYYLNIPAEGERATERLGADGRFTPAPLPEWASIAHCVSFAIEDPPAIIAPIVKAERLASPHEGGIHVVESFARQPDRCLIARLDQMYLRDSLFPQLIEQSFGATAAADYDFSVISINQPQLTLYGKFGRADLRRPFFSIEPVDLAFARARAVAHPAAGKTSVIVQRVESSVVSTGSTRMASLFGPGIWQLNVARKGMPLAAAFERKRWQDLVASLAVEMLLLGAIVFLVIAARRMQLLADRKMQFVAGVSHELRTPVSAIAMLSRNQADGLVTGADRVKQYGELMHQQCRRLNEMVEQTLQYAGIHSQVRRPMQQEVDLRRLIEDALSDRREELVRGGIQTEIALSPDLPKIVGDAQWLRTAVDNLLSNAQKYGEGGHWIGVSASYAEAAHEVRISVQDRGAGIDPADRDEIFEPFCRGRAASDAQIPGSGLGLSLVRSAAEAHRGSVTLVSELGRGSTFTLHLPA